MRVAYGLTLSLVFVLPAHALSCNSSQTASYSVPSGSGPASYYRSDYYTVLNSGSVTFSTVAATHNAINVGSGGGKPDSCGFTFTNQGSVSITAPSSDAGPTDFRILNLYALGTDKSQGESPDPGGQAGPITVNLGGSVSFNSQIASFAYGAYGVWIQSLGGKGDASEKEGVAGASGGASAAVAATISDASVSVQVASAKTGAAVRIEQVGGTGGAGTNDGAGGTGGTAQAQSVTVRDSRLTAAGPGIAGLVVRQIGGAGGSGGLESNEQNSSGGSGGRTDGITLTLAQGSGAGNVISTAGDSAPAMSVLAQGGAGGVGADTGGAFQFDSIGGNGGGGGTPGSITLSSTGQHSLTTSGASSPGILVSSQGGVGGAGGRAYSATNGSSGSGGGGGIGGLVTINLAGNLSIRTTGKQSPGVSASSSGGDGGVGGYAGSDTYAQSGNGGSGGGGGTVNVTLGNGVRITTTGEESHGTYVLSKGALGAKASEAAGGLGYAKAGNGGNGGGSNGLYVSNAGSIATSGSSARGILAQAVAGFGGNGGPGDAALGGDNGDGGTSGRILMMTAQNLGQITTAGDGAQGMLVQSIGGGGGTGGSGSGSLFYNGGGDGGYNIADSTGGPVTVTNRGSIVTTGAAAAGILAQSIGGGGGDGGSGSAVFGSVGGDAAPGGPGGTIDATIAGSITTAGQLSHGLIAQSIGGGGGSGGNATSAGTLVTYAVGGDAAGGGSGGIVNVTGRDGTITTSGGGAAAILAQSIGGGGGSGGSATATSGGISLAISAAVGGTGGDGGDGSNVTVALDNVTIKTSGADVTFQDPREKYKNQTRTVDAIGILAQSIGGGGGVGGGANALAFAGTLPAPPDDVEIAIAADFALGGSGGKGGNGADVLLLLGRGTNGGSGSVTVKTAGNGAHAVMAQSIGGGGGQGGDSSAMAATFGSTSLYGNLAGETTSLTLSAAVGGKPGTAGNGGSVNLFLAGAGSPVLIETTGDAAFGIQAQSIGGGGGNAGVGTGQFNFTGNAENHRATLGVGSQGGDGGNGGTAALTLDVGSTVRTSGSGSIGVLVQSVGDGGGTATGSTLMVGPLVSEEKGPTKAEFVGQVSVGSQGGKGGAGGAASVVNRGSVTTIGNDAPAIQVQSIGGGGGVGGAAGVDAGAGEGEEAPETADVATPRSPARTTASASSGKVPVKPQVTLDTTLSLSLGGQGGTGGNGGVVTLDHSGQLATSGDYAQGLVAQSIGKGGGRGGTAVVEGEGNSFRSVVGTGIVKSTVGLGASGDGGSGGSGGSVTVNLAGGASVTTGLAGQGSMGSGVQSVGILAQSVGGGGGIGADGTVQPNGLLFLGAGLVGGGGASGNGGAVTLRQTSGSTPVTVTTYGASGHGIVAQSVGAGGGVAGAGSTLKAGLSRLPDVTVDLKLGGNAASGGNGGTVLVDSPQLAVRTSGMGAYGLIAQSVGGGGGLAEVTGSTANLQGLGGQGARGDGGKVSVSLPDTASITTTGLGAHGLVAQSIGGGGGIANGYQAGVTPAFANPMTFGTASGNGGSVYVTSQADITTTGPGAFGIIAQSVGRGGGLGTIGSQFYAASMGGSGSQGTAGIASVVLQGTISATGENAVGVFAQSVNGQNVSANTVTVNLGYFAPARVTGGTGQGAGIWIESGNASNSIYVGQGSSVAALSNLAINYTGGSGVNVTNDGTITGSTHLGSSAYTLTNRGTLQSSATGTGQAVIAGSFIQTPSGRLATRTDFVAGTAGRFIVTGDAQLAGTVQTSLASVVANRPVPVLTVQGQATGNLSAASTALFDFDVVSSSTEDGRHFSLVATGSRLADSRFALTQGRQAAAAYLDRVFAAGAPQFGTLFADLDRAAASPGDYGQRIGQIGPRSTLSVGAWRSQNAAFAVNAAMSCPVFTAGTAFLTEGTCTYARLGGQTAVVNGDSDRGRLNADTTILQIGGQGEVAPGWFLGGSLAYENGRIGARDGVQGLADVGHGVLTLKRQDGPWLLTGAVFGSVGNIDLWRSNGLSGFGGMGVGSATPTTLGGRLRAAFTVALDDLYIRPFVNLDVIHSRLGSYTEAGLGALGLRYEASDQVTAVVTPAVEFGVRKTLSSDLVLRGFASAGVDIRSDNAWRSTARLVGAPSTVDGFTTIVPQSRAAARIGAGLQLFAGDNVDLRAQYDGSFSDRATSHGGFVTFSYRM